LADVESWLRCAAGLIPVGLFAWLSFRRPRRKKLPETSDAPYRVFTTDFDLVLPAAEVIPRLAAASLDRDQGHSKGPKAWEAAVAEMEASFVEQRAAFDLGRAGTLARLREAGAGIDPGDVAVALLIDQSGSMKGSPIASAAATATPFADLIADYGARSEILGFSTAGWHGGHARMKWIAAGRPRLPGRLCALMHVVYKSADAPVLGDEARRVMVHPDLLRENVDGEALLWARERLAALPERHKLLIVISDGAPVDDSTLTENASDILWRHLMAVREEIEADPQFVLGGVGLAHDVEAYYWLAETAPTAADLPDATVRLLERMLAAASESAAEAIAP
jgi:cobaltochelatase CobT